MITFVLHSLTGSSSSGPLLGILKQPWCFPACFQFCSTPTSYYADFVLRIMPLSTMNALEDWKHILPLWSLPWLFYFIGTAIESLFICIKAFIILSLKYTLTRWFLSVPSKDQKLSLAVVVVQLLSRVWLFETPWSIACQALLSTVSQVLLKLSIESVMLFNHLMLCRPLSLASICISSASRTKPVT